MNFVEQQARQVTARVDPSIMLGDARKNLQGLSEKHSISDVDRACKRLGAWTRLMMSLIPYKDAVCKDLVMSPVDPSTSKRRWESHLFELRQCVDLLQNELPGTCGEFIDMCPDSPAEIWKDDFRGGASSAGIICSLRAGGADEDTGRQQLAFTHEQWCCLSAKRRTALVRQEARQEAKDSDDYLCFLRMWHKSFSLYCCPSYTARTQLQKSVFLVSRLQTNSFLSFRTMAMILFCSVDFPTYNVNFSFEGMDIPEMHASLLRKQRTATMSMAAECRYP